MNTPRNLVELTCSNFSLSILRNNPSVIGVTFLENRIYFVLVGFTESWLALNQSVRLFRSEFTCSYNTLRFVPLRYIWLCHRRKATNIDLQYDKGLGISLEYNMNKRGPRTDPCGTPKDMISVSELVLK